MANKKTPVKKTSRPIVDDFVETNKEEKKYKYILRISVNDTVVSTETNDILSALKDFPVPEFIKTETIVTIVSDRKVRDVSLKTFEARRIFNNETALLLFADKLSNLIN